MAHMNFGQVRPGNIKRVAMVLVASCAISFMAACSSGTKLNDVAVEDKKGAPVGAVKPVTPSSAAASGAAAGSEVGERAVQPGTIEGNQASAAGPANATKIIYFDYDSYTIKAEFQSALDAHARFLNTNKARKLAIEGHTDERGGREYNLALGQKRAEAVRRALALLGVTDVQIEAVSFGKEKPAALGSDESSWALNRRAEINYR
jgi:peptidoglycan-associated lipoprotein